MPIHCGDNPCVHWWYIQSPNGPVSKGQCRLCGEEGEFANIGTPKQGRGGMPGFVYSPSKTQAETDINAVKTSNIRYSRKR